jgi:hypothetical protein
MRHPATLAPEGGAPAYCMGCPVRGAGNYKTMQAKYTTPSAFPLPVQRRGLPRAKALFCQRFPDGYESRPQLAWGLFPRERALADSKRSSLAQ